MRAALILLLVLGGCKQLPLSLGMDVDLSEHQLERQLEGMERRVQGLPHERFMIKADLQTEEIKTILTRREDRFEALLTLLEGGRIGIENGGNLARREGDSAPSAKEEEMILALLGEENQDREALVQSVARFTKAKGGLKTTRAVYTIVLRRLARKGWWMQKTDGTWIRKDL